jgi:hypothetical protein
MVRTLIQADDFRADVDAIRARALELTFAPVDYMGETYSGIGLGYDPGLEPDIERMVGFKINPKLKFFRLSVQGDKPSTYIHADTICAEYATVYYLSPTGMGGTAFWTHKELGWDRLPTASELKEIVAEKGLGYLARLEEDGMHQDRWALNSVVGMKYNRFICYPTKMFHSRYPKDCWGRTKEDGRLIWVCMFDRA